MILYNNNNKKVYQKCLGGHDNRQVSVPPSLRYNQWSTMWFYGPMPKKYDTFSFNFILRKVQFKDFFHISYSQILLSEDVQCKSQQKEFVWKFKQMIWKDSDLNSISTYYLQYDSTNALFYDIFMKVV